MSTVDRLDLDAIRQRAEAATKGPWRPAVALNHGIDKWRIPIQCDAPIGEGETAIDTLAVVEYQTGGFQYPHADARADAEFIAAAREDVPALLAKVERQRALIDNARTAYADLVCREAERSGHGRDGHLDVDDLRPLFDALCPKWGESL